MAEGEDVPELLLWLVLKTVRERRALSQREMAAKLGVTQPVVSRWESGESAIGEDTLAKYAGALGVSVRELLLEGLAGTAAPQAPAEKKTTARKKRVAKR